MGLIRAAVGTIGGTLADQWLEAIEPAKIDNTILATYGVSVSRRKNARGSNRKGTEDVISNGSIIHVPENVFMLLVDGGKIISATDQPGYYQVDNSRSPSIFFQSDENVTLPGYNNTERNAIQRPGGIVNTLKDSWERFKFGGTTPLKQRVIYINNPTGVIYKEDMLKGMNDVITAAKKKYGTQIFFIADEPYVKIVYDGKKVPSVFNFFKNAISVNSFSKSLAVPGERIGYIAVSPEIDNADLLMDALIFCNRTLGYVNAPAVGQHIVIDCINESIDVEYYKKRRDLLYNALVDLGFKCIKPEGAFYLFPESPIPDDVAFTKLALKYNLIIVPGSGFGCGGYLRLTYCVDYEMIERSLPAFEKLAKEVF